MAQLDCDVAVIGAGTAGLSAERKARDCGARTLLIDPEFAGTTCASVGCMPSKLLIAAADAAHEARRADVFGVHADPRIDGPAVMRRLRNMRDGFVQGVKDGIARLPDEVRVKATAAFAGPNMLDLSNGDTVRAGAIVIATGSTPKIPEPFRDLGDLVLTNATIFELDDLPDSMGVIGAGPIGVELAQAMARLGVRVEVFDMGDTVGGLPGPSSAALARILRDEFPLHLGVTPKTRKTTDGVEISIDGHTATFDRLLVATGRPPELDSLHLDRSGLTLTDKGAPEFDRQTMRCGDSHVFIAGDVNADRPLLHEASDEGAIAGHNAACPDDIRTAERKLPMAVTFTRPSASVLGRIPDDDDTDHVTGTADYADQGRTKVMAHPGGLLRLHAERATGRIVGADLCLPDGEHIAHLLAWTITQGLTVDDALRMPFYHPTVEEGMKPALRELCKKIDSPMDWAADDGAPPGV